MAKIVYAPLTRANSGRATPGVAGSVQTKTITAPDGTKVRMASVDADSPTFSQDLTSAFRRNVARLRRENRRQAEEVGRLAPES